MVYVLALSEGGVPRNYLGDGYCTLLQVALSFHYFFVCNKTFYAATIDVVLSRLLFSRWICCYVVMSTLHNLGKGTDDTSAILIVLLVSNVVASNLV